MAVYERTYKRYEGPITSQTWRFLVFPRYVFQQVFKSKLLVFYYAFCFIVPLLSSVVIYMINNLQLLENLAFLQQGLQGATINAPIVLWFMTTQGFFALFLSIFIGPGLVSRDLANNGLALYLCRPISRAEFVLGKASVLFILISSITWVPGLMLYFLQGIMDDGSWMMDNLRLAVAIVVGEMLWAMFLSLLALALSAWVKWRMMAAFAMFLVFPLSFMVRGLWTLLFENDLGAVLSPIEQITMIWTAMLGIDIEIGAPLPVAWIGLALLSGFCLLLLHLKIRAYEVVS